MLYPFNRFSEALRVISEVSSCFKSYPRRRWLVLREVKQQNDCLTDQWTSWMKPDNPIREFFRKFQEEDLPKSYNKLLVRTVCCVGHDWSIQLCRTSYLGWGCLRDILYDGVKTKATSVRISVQSKYCNEALLCSFSVCTIIVRSDLHLTSLCSKKNILCIFVFCLKVVCMKLSNCSI